MDEYESPSHTKWECKFHVVFIPKGRRRARSASAISSGKVFWARGYFVSTVGRDETVMCEYIRNQEWEDTRLDQLNLWR